MAALDDQGTVRLFQYGSNMARDRFSERIDEEYDRHAPPGTPVIVELLGPARLDGWRLRANLWSCHSRLPRRQYRQGGRRRSVGSLVRHLGGSLDSV
jgi:hypothetical protein